MDGTVRARITIALGRLEEGNFSATKGEGAGIHALRMDFGPGSVFERPGGPKGQSLSVFEAFKVYGGKIHAVEAFMKVKPADQPLGWE